MTELFRSLESAALGHEETLDAVLGALAFNADGLIPAIAQDQADGTVLMLAWMNREALERTLAEGYACYYSRSRQTLWRKGETSGHLQRVVEVRFDCDGDAVLLTVEQTGPACHTNRPSCFYLAVDAGCVRVISQAP
ncbi:MAG: phosphoribosyl-AMP cyclohydrolase [Pseudomonadales bacterium]